MFNSKKFSKGDIIQKTKGISLKTGKVSSGNHYGLVEESDSIWTKFWLLSHKKTKKKFNSGTNKTKSCIDNETYISTGLFKQKTKKLKKLKKCKS